MCCHRCSKTGVAGAWTLWWQQWHLVSVCLRKCCSSAGCSTVGPISCSHCVCLDAHHAPYNRTLFSLCVFPRRHGHRSRGRAVSCLPTFSGCHVANTAAAHANWRIAETLKVGASRPARAKRADACARTSCADLLVLSRFQVGGALGRARQPRGLLPGEALPALPCISHPVTVAFCSQHPVSGRSTA